MQGNDDLGGVRQFLAEGYADQRIGLGIYRGGRIIQDQNTRFSEVLSRYTGATSGPPDTLVPPRSM